MDLFYLKYFFASPCLGMLPIQLFDVYIWFPRFMQIGAVQGGSTKSVWIFGWYFFSENPLQVYNLKKWDLHFTHFVYWITGYPGRRSWLFKTHSTVGLLWIPLWERQWCVYVCLDRVRIRIQSRKSCLQGTFFHKFCLQRIFFTKKSYLLRIFFVFFSSVGYLSVFSSEPIHWYWKWFDAICKGQQWRKRQILITHPLSDQTSWDTNRTTPIQFQNNS